MSDQITSDGDITGKRNFQIQTPGSWSLNREMHNLNLEPHSTSVGTQGARISGTQRKSSLYDYKNGLCLIFNHKTYDMGRHSVRNGTDVDRDALKSYFEGIGFRVPCPFEDLTVEETFSTLSEYANNDDNFDCLVCIFLTHGSEDSLAAYDVDYEMQLIFTPFLSQNCPKLRGKAKLFFINACQGSALGEGNVLVKPKESHDACNVPMVPRDDHFIFAMSTVRGFLSLRHLKDGTFYVQSLVKTLNKCGTTEDIHTILTTVNREMALELKYGIVEDFTKHQYKQMPIFWTSLLDKFYFRITPQR